MFKTGDVIRFTYEKEKLKGVITKVNNRDYVQVLTSDGRTFSSVYTGYVKGIGKTVDLEAFLKEIG